MKNKYLCKNLTALMLAASMAIASIGCGKTEAPAPAEEKVEEADKETSEETAKEDEASKKDEAAETSDKVAGEGEKAESVDVLEPGMVPVTAEMLNAGTYSIEVNSSSSMFKITACELIVGDGEMYATMTMGGKGYLYVFPGTGEEAAAAVETAGIADEDVTDAQKMGEAGCIAFVENDSEEHTFTIPVKALDDVVPCAAFSKKKEKWYDRDLAFKAASLDTAAFKEGVYDELFGEAEGTEICLEAGEYICGVALEGGSGKASIESPTKLISKDGNITAIITWSSKNYDYMIVDGERIEPISREEASVFEIPVLKFDAPFKVIADTVAMGNPHEIEYTLNFESMSISEAE